ncbi:DUF1499 domain-containing protein [Ascidiaceihabitans sp.]|uniref:DUF1499 domain-containing protein n=1 Tax=Ascidiaceihabitans sp. TaxID=1872644 RepID=UPI0032983A50
MAIWGILLLVVAGLAYIRLAPSDPARWHIAIEADNDKRFAAGAIRVTQAGPDALALVDKAAQALPRTSRLAGSVEDGHITYITRSKLMGFPDYTTVQQINGTLKLHARLRFGRSDLGVNDARLGQLLAALP